MFVIMFEHESTKFPQLLLPLLRSLLYMKFIHPKSQNPGKKTRIKFIHINSKRSQEIKLKHKHH